LYEKIVKLTRENKAIKLLEATVESQYKYKLLLKESEAKIEELKL
jgi:hypothetical protein